MRAFLVESDAGGDPCAGDHEQDAAAFRYMLGTTAQGGDERSGMHTLVVCDDDPFDRNLQPIGECGAVVVPGRSGDDDVDIGDAERGPVQAVACHLGGSAIVSPGLIRLASSSSTRATVWVVDAVFPCRSTAITASCRGASPNDADTAAIPLRIARAEV